MFIMLMLLYWGFIASARSVILTKVFVGSGNRNIDLIVSAKPGALQGECALIKHWLIIC